MIKYKLPILILLSGFIFVTPQEHLSGIESTKLKNIEKKREGETTIVTLHFSNTIAKTIKKDNIYPKEILNCLTMTIKGKTMIITYKTSLLNGKNKTLTFVEALIDYNNKAIKEFSINL